MPPAGPSTKGGGAGLRAAHAGATAALALVLVAPAAPRAAPPVPSAVAAADSLAGAGPSRDRDRLLERWASRASLAELMFVLRRPPTDLRAAETPLVEAALKRTPVERGDLRRRLQLRLATLDPGGEAWRALAPSAARLPSRPRASVFRVGVVLPDSGDYEGFAASVRLGLEVGLAQQTRGGALPLVVSFEPSGDDAPERVAAAFDRAAEGSGVIVGGLLSGPTSTLATAARLTGLPMLSPAATDEGIGAIGPRVFQVGPSGLQRGRALARSVLADGPRRIGVLTAGPLAGNPFARGFAAAAESLGAHVVWTATYAAGSSDYRPELKALAAQSVELLFWDGEARDAETLIRQMARDAMHVGICGGAELDPERHHAMARPLFEGVRFAGEDWVLSAGSQAVLDSAVRAAGEERAGRLHARGYLAARLVASAVEGGALCPEELGAALATRVGDDPYLRAHGFLAWTPAEATLPVYVVTRGRAVLP